MCLCLAQTSASLGLWILQAGVYEDEQDLGQPFEKATWPSHGQQVPNQSHHAGEKPCKR